MDKQEINTAISEHAIWKFYLNKLIHDGRLKGQVEGHKECAFGKWFYGDIALGRLATSEHYEKVKEIHVEFHKIAAEVADLAAKGETKKAEKLMEYGGEFDTISVRLTEAMTKWKDSI